MLGIRFEFYNISSSFSSLIYLYWPHVPPTYLEKLLLLYLPVLPILLLSSAIVLTTMLGAFKRRWKTRSGSGTKKSKIKSPKGSPFGDGGQLGVAHSPIISSSVETSNAQLPSWNGEDNKNVDCQFKCNISNEDQFDGDNIDCNNLLIEKSSDLLYNCKDSHIIEEFKEKEEEIKDFTNGNINSNDAIYFNINTDSDEKTDALKEALESEIGQLQTQLQVERNNVREERETIRRMELQVKLSSSKENLMIELQQERTLRCEAERKLEEMRNECDTCRHNVAKLQDDFKRMEDIVRGMLSYKTKFDQLKIEKNNSVQSYECKIKKYDVYIENLRKENMLLVEELKNLEAKHNEENEEPGIGPILMQRLQYLEEENKSLVIENDQQRHQYEQCLDDVANQVVQALLSQKALREECKKLQTRVTDLEQQNKSLSNYFMHRFHDKSRPVDAPVQSGLCSRTKLYPHQSSTSLSRYSYPVAFCNKASMTDCIEGQQGHSDNSSESLASLCSDYSANSPASSSGNVSRSRYGNQRPSSPPAWFHEAEAWPKVPSFRRNQNYAIQQTKHYNPNSYGDDTNNARFTDNEKGISTADHRYFNGLESILHSIAPPSSPHFANNSARTYKNSTPVLDSNQSPSEFFDSGLDALETPNEDAPIDILETSEENPSSSLSRPTTLNLALNKSLTNIEELQYLNCKQHEPNKGGNIYVDPSKNIGQVLHVSQAMPSEAGTPYCDVLTESTESGTKDEGYSTMSSDVQGVELSGPIENAQEAVGDRKSQFHDVIKAKEMKEICEEDENEDSCSNFARELATSVVKCENSNMEVLSARSGNLISLFSPQGYKPKTNVDPLKQTRPVSYPYQKHISFFKMKNSDSSSLLRTSSDSTIYVNNAEVASSSVRSSRLKGRNEAGKVMTKSCDASYPAGSSSSIRRSHRVLPLNHISIPPSCTKSKGNLFPQESKAYNSNIVESNKWIWEWEPLNSSENTSDLNGSDAGFFVTSLPPLTKIREDDKSSPKNLYKPTSFSLATPKPTDLFIGSSPELSKRSYSPIDTFKSSSFRRSNKKVASVSPFKLDRCESETGSCNSRLSWCSEELNLTSLDNCLPVKENRHGFSEEVYHSDNVDSSDQIVESSLDNLETKFTSDFYKLCHVDSNKNLASNTNVPEGNGKLKQVSKIPTSVCDSPKISNTSFEVERECKDIAIPVVQPQKFPQKSSPLKSPTKSAIPVAKKPAKMPEGDQEKARESHSGARRKATKLPSKTQKSKPESRIPVRGSQKCKTPANSPTKHHRPQKKTTTEQIKKLNQMFSFCADSEEVLFESKPVAPPKPKRTSIRSKRSKKRKEGCVTSWIHVEADVDLSDPKARANLLDCMLASSSSSDTSTSSDDDTIAERQHLHALHRFRRRKKRAESDKEQVLRYIPAIRPSIMNCPEFFYRYGEKEREAVSYFDFLDELSTPTSGDYDEEQDLKDLIRVNKYENSSDSNDSDCTSISEEQILSPIVEESYELDDYRGSSSLHSSQVYETNRLSLSDSCAESYSSSENSFTFYTK